jgi:hypothetical protein
LLISFLVKTFFQLITILLWTEKRRGSSRSLYFFLEKKMETLMDLPVRGKFYGVRGSFPHGDVRIGGHTTCHTMQFADTLVIFDTGSGMLDLGDELMKPFLMPGKTMDDV